MRTLLAALLIPLASLTAPLAVTADAAVAAPAGATATGGSFTLSSASVTTGDQVTASGTFKKAYAGRKVALQVANGAAWKTLVTRTTTAKGSWSIAFKTSSAGTMKLRALVSGGVVKGHRTPKAATAPKVLKVADVVIGSEDEPFTPGQSFKNGTWTFSFGATDLDAWPELQAADPDNVAPAAGWSYVIVPVTFRNDSATAEEPYSPTDIELQGGDDELYSETTDDDQDCGSVPNDWADAPALAPGASVTRNVCAVVPTAQLRGGLWDVFNDDADDDAYVTLS